MKYSLSLKAGYTGLSTADEIIVEYKDINAVPDICHKYPDASILITHIPTDCDEQKIRIASKSTKNQVTFVIPPFVEPIAKFKDYNYMFDTVCENLTQAYNLVNYGACRVVVGGCLIFNVKDIAKIPVPIMLNPTAHSEEKPFAFAYIPLAPYKPVLSGYIRPEDAKIYDGDNVYFYFDMGERDAAFAKVYRKGEWGGDISYLFPQLPSIEGRFIWDDFGIVRANCGQRCMFGACGYCEGVFRLANNINHNREFIKSQLD